MNGRTAIIIGGTFNPITKAHLQMGILIQERFSDADIWYVPTNLKFISKWKETNSSLDFWNDYNNRIIPMTHVLQEYRFLWSLHEVTNLTNGTTYASVKFFNNCGYNKIYICIGFDKINEIPYWTHAEELMEETNLLLFTRKNQGKKDITNEFILKYLDKITEIEMPKEYQYISSTKVREAFNNGKLDDIKDMLPEIIYQDLTIRKEQEQNGKKTNL